MASNSTSRTDVTRRQVLKSSGIVGATSLAGCANLFGQGNDELSGVDTFVFATSGEQQGLDPRMHSVTSTITWQPLVFNSLIKLVKKEDGTWGYEGDLATEYEWIEEDGEHLLQFQIQDGVTFHNGDTVTAERIMEDIKWRLNPDNNSSGLADSSLINFLDTESQFVSVDNESTLNIHFPEPNALALTTLNDFAIANHAIREEMGPDEFNLNATGKNSPGSGPYKLMEWNEGSGITFEQYDDYWEDGLPKFEAAELKVIPENSTRATQLRSGDVHFDTFAPLGSWKDFDENENDGVTAASNKSVAMPMLSTINHNVEPLDNRQVRLAMRLASNGQAIIDAQFEGVGDPVSAPVLPDSQFGFPDLASQNLYDPERAQSVLEEAGHGDGFEIEMIVPPKYETSAQVLQQNWDEVGIDLSINTIEYQTVYSRILEGDFETHIGEFKFGNDLLRVFHGTVWDGGTFKPASLGWNADATDAYVEFEDAYFAARRANSLEEQIPHLETMYEIFVAENPYLVYSSGITTAAHRDGLENVAVPPNPDRMGRVAREFDWAGN